MINIILTGPPGSGKGTQSECIVKQYSLVHVEAGTIIRNKAASDPEIKKIVKQGHLVPDQTTFQFIKEYISNSPAKKGFVFDGYPRNREQAKDLERLLSGYNESIDSVIFLEVPEEIVIKRIKKRGETSGRNDDQRAESIKERMKNFHKETEPLIAYFDEKGLLRKVKGSGTKREVFERLTMVLEEDINLEIKKMTDQRKKVLLVILDGWGKEDNPKLSTIAMARTPFIDSLFEKYPHSIVRASGVAVGLPEKQMGNSEVGHINIGAGRVIYQMLLKINLAIKDKSFYKNKVILDAFQEAKENNRNVHIMGLVSNGGVHSHIDHLKALTEIAAQQQLQNVFIHAFTDGRDSDPKSGIGFLKDLQKHLHKTTGILSTVMGRYYSMDRDQRWQQRIKPAYDALVHAKGKQTDALFSLMEEKYKNDETDEFIKPIVLVKEGAPIATINDGDMVICFNFRTDRCREITKVLTQENMLDEGMQKLDLKFLTMTRYDESFKNIGILFESENITRTLGEVISSAGKKQLRIAESIKYPHVTFFFNGGREKPFEGEERIMCKTPGVETFDKQPEMAAKCVAKKASENLKKQDFDFICMNFANADMVGHTGNTEAAIKACETVDSCTKLVVETALENEYLTLLISDHGNAEKIKNADGSSNTEHTLNPVPLIFIGNNMDHIRLKNGKLSDVAPTILDIMELDKPKEMKGNSLIELIIHE